jgi:lipoprotein signal peptidase
MQNKKLIIYLMLGILAAAVVCIIAGLITYLIAANTTILQTAEHYSELVYARNYRMALGLTITYVGVAIAIPPLVVLIIILIINAVSAHKNKNINN